MKTSALALLIGVCFTFTPRIVSGQPAVEALPTADLPLSRAVLFASGVGYFEHAGTVRGDAQLVIRFKTDQINDVLKSMVLMDAGGGQVASVTYAADEPLERALGSFGINLSHEPTLPQILGRLRGAKVALRAPDLIEGHILAVEEKTKIVGLDQARITEHVLSLVTGGGIRSLPLSSIESLEFAEAKLRQELSKALELLAQSRDTDSKPVMIQFLANGVEGPRPVRVGYLVETPVWKTSYRLDLTPLTERDKARLQGWAIVENTSDADWNAVNLSLVSGRPISFVMDLYTPLYLDRPVVRPQLMASLRPRIYEEGLSARDELPARGDARTRAGGPAMPAAAPTMMMDRKAAEQMDAAAGFGGFSLDSVAAAASGGGVGELFQFTLIQPVDMPRRRSAMLPIINESIAAEKVSIYNEQAQAKHPLNGVWMRNDTGLKMLAGPITVFDGGAYAGDAQIDHLAPGDKRLLSYAVDLAVLVDPSMRQDNQIVSAKLVRGVLQISHLNTFEQTYAIHNKAELPRALVIEHPFHPARELVEPAQAEEKTANLYRFRTVVEAQAQAKFVVRERQTTRQTIAILDVSADSLLWVTQNGRISQRVRDAIARAIEMKHQLAQLQSEMNERMNELNAIKQGQERLRQNIATTGPDSTLGKRYLAKLSQEEDRIEQLDREITELRRQIEAKQKELADYLQGLNVE